MGTNLNYGSGTGVDANSTIPAWVDGLSTASIRADMTAADVNGSVTYSGLEKLFSDLEATLSTSKSSLTAAEMSDLKTVAANLNNGMSTSSYLAYITNALVDGNAANATWTDGAASGATLGNLAVGSSATQLTELNEKWFKGGDLPSLTFPAGESCSTPPSYSASTGPLFGPSGPQMHDVNQGSLGDCYFLSSLAEVAKHNPGIISSMFTDNGNNTYGVRFHVDGVATYVTVDNSLVGGGYTNTATSIWASLAEKAYAQLQADGDFTGSPHNEGNSWSAIDGGFAGNALEAITGASAITFYQAHAKSNSWSTSVYDSSMQVTSSSSGTTTDSLRATLVSDLSQGDDLILGSCKEGWNSHGMETLVPDHAMSIYGYDSATNMFEIRNPWGTPTDGLNYAPTFEVGLRTLLADGDSITVDNVGNAVGKLTQAIAVFSAPGSALAATPVPADAVPAASPALVSPMH